MPLFDSQKIHLKFYIRKSKTWKAKNTHPLETPVSKSEFCGFWLPSHNAKAMKTGLDANKVPFLPDQNGNIKAEPVYTLSQGCSLHASRFILVQF